jgi:prephenate dehydrogenase
MTRPGPPARLSAAGGLRTVAVVGTGLIGTSVALALRARNIAVWLTDRDSASARLAADLGAGEVLPAAGPGQRRADLAVLAVPPEAVAPALAGAQSARLARAYTDVASVKSLPLARARELGCDVSCFVPGHPLSGRERSGPAAARAEMFLGRPWVLCPAPETSAEALAAATALVRSCRAEPVQLSAGEHDRYVALVSHAPHVVAAAMAARLAGAPPAALALAGAGLRDVTRIAAGDPALWSQILAANAAPAGEVLAAVAADLSAAAAALAEAAPAAAALAEAGPAPAGPSAAPAVKVLTALLADGRAGAARIPGKHGRPARDDAVVQVVIGDQPGELARLFGAAGEAGVNIEDVGIEHSPGLPVGVAELTVRRGAAARLRHALAAAGWPVRR